MARHLAGLRTALGHELLGVGFLVLLVVCAWLAYAVYAKKFTDYAEVTLRAGRTGLQLPPNADVKIRGVVVGLVRDVRVADDGTRLTLGLYPDKVGVIPANVSARILPKTLFGQKYVALQVPAEPSSRSIAAGAVISETRVGIEVEKVLSDIYPLLRTVQPAQLNYTLTAVANALEGRGERLGHSLVVLDRYLGRMNPQLPVLVRDLRQLSSVSETYREVVPELAELLRNSVTTGNTFVTMEQKVQALFDDVAGFAGKSREFLGRNGDNVIRLGRIGQAELPLFAKYSAEYPCLLEGLVRWAPRMAQAYRGHTLHIDVETIPRQPRGYDPGDSPEYAEHDARISLDQCWDSVNGRWGQADLPPRSLNPPIDDGVDYPLGKGRAQPGFDLTSGVAGTSGERALVDALAAPVMGVPADRVPGVASLLFGPLARGTEVSLR